MAARHGLEDAGAAAAFAPEPAAHIHTLDDMSCDERADIDVVSSANDFSMFARLPLVCLDRVVCHLAPEDIARLASTCRDLRSRLPSVHVHLPAGSVWSDCNLHEQGPGEGHWWPK